MWRVNEIPDGRCAASRWVTAGWAAVVGVLLGAGAIAADLATGGWAEALQLVSSTGLAWGAGAVLIGARSASRRWASIGGLAVLWSAVGVYYGGIVVLDTRPGTAPSTLAFTLLVWLAVSIVAGPSCGLVGWVATHGGPTARSVAVGTGAGVLAAQGLFEAVRARHYLLEPNARATLVACVLLVGVPAVLLALGRRRVRVGLAAAVALAATVLGAGMWWAVVETLGSTM